MQKHNDKPDNNSDISKELSELYEAFTEKTPQPAPKKPSGYEKAKHARQMVITELQHHCMSRDLSNAVQDALRKTWVVYMCMVHLREGVNSRPWNVGIQLLNDFLDLADPPPGFSPDTQRRENCLQRLNRCMESIQTPKKIRKSLILELKQALENPILLLAGEDIPGFSAQINQQGQLQRLQLILDKTQWVEIFDEASHQHQWLRVLNISAELSMINFGDINNKPVCSVSFSEFIDGVARNKHRLVNPSPRQKALMEELIADRIAISGF